MIEHLVILVIEALARREKAEQQVALDSIVADLDQLRDDPAAVLVDREIVIPPARHGPLAFLVAAGLGVVMFLVVLASWVLLRPHLPNPNPIPKSLRPVLAWAMLPVLLGFIGLGYYWARGWLRGGELVLKRQAAEFRYRNST